MGETRDRGIPATPDGIAKLKNAKNTGKDDNGKPWTFPSIAEKAGIQGHKTVGGFSRVKELREVMLTQFAKL